MKTISPTITADSLANKICCVTGGARGIGAAIVRRLSEAGCRVAFSYLHSTDAAEVLSRECGAVAIKADSSTEEGANALLSAAVKRFGRVNVLINNAGSALYKLVQDTTESDFDTVIGNNLKATFVNCKIFTPHFVCRKSGKIINITSMWGEHGGAVESAYSAAKAGVIGLTKALAKELAPSGITVNAVSCGAVATDMLGCFSAEELKTLASEVPLGRIAEPSEIAAVVRFFVSSDSDYITGQVLGVNGGLY